MIEVVSCTALSIALQSLKEKIKCNEDRGLKTVVFCEDRLSLAAERTVCSAVGGTFLTSVYTFSRFLASEYGKGENVLSAQGSAMAIRRIIEENRSKLTVFGKLTAATAAQIVYDTIALLYSSRISAEDALTASERGGLLGGKLKDLALIYGEYMSFLEESGKEDRNAYLKRLAGVVEKSLEIRGNCVIFLGFQAFTSTTSECVRAAFSAASEVVGLFISGKEDIYVNEAIASFTGLAEEFGGAVSRSVHGELLTEAEHLRTGLFNPESFHLAALPTERVQIFEASDEEEELEFIAARIKKHVIDGGERYAKISVMLPDLNEAEAKLARVFSQYNIPYYADRRISLSEHPLSAFVFALLSCAVSGCRPQDVDLIVASPFFPAERADKDIFRNYALKLANYKGGVRRQPDPEILKGFGFDFNAVERVRAPFVKAMTYLDAKGGKRDIFGGLRSILEQFGVEKRLEELSEIYKDEYPVAAAFGARAYKAAVKVLDEAESLSADVPLKEIIAILKSGFAAMEISLIPPKADAVFVGDLTQTANTGSEVVFAAQLSGDVPGASPDTALLTDREITMLESVNLKITPKIRQVNARRREIAALNICAFRKNLYLSYCLRLKGEEVTASEIISYAKAIFLTPSGNKLAPVQLKDNWRKGRELPYYASERRTALKQLVRLRLPPEYASSLYKMLCDKGLKEEADAVLGINKNGQEGNEAESKKEPLDCGEELYLVHNSLSPTALESYFACPYLSFMRQGLRVQEREEGAVREVDTGNFIHSVLQDLAHEIKDLPGKEALISRAEELAKSKLDRAPYSQLLNQSSGRYTAAELIKEAVKVACVAYEQLKNSGFSVVAAERECTVELKDGVKIYGRTDRVDESEDMVRIIDYKTGSVDLAAAKYYTGLKLQLPLYLLAASEGKRAVGAYYLPTAIVYNDNEGEEYRLKGFMDGSEEVVAASDKFVQPKQKSKYVDAYFKGRKIDAAMESGIFKDFLEYSKLIAQSGAEEMLAGNVAPSPSEDTCKYCKMGGSCNFAVGREGAERKPSTIKCEKIAEIAGRKKNA